MTARFEVFKDIAGNWRWKLYASNNERIAVSGESFASSQEAVRSCETVRRAALGAPIAIRQQRAVGVG